MAAFRDFRPPDFTIIVLAKSRVECLRDLLASIQQTDFGTDDILLTIRLDWSNDQDDVLKFAEDFNFLHGNKEVIVSHYALGLARSWFLAWIPKSEHEHAIILEDDIILSSCWYQWLKGAWDAYGTREELAGISLQRQTLIPHQVEETALDVSGSEPFLFSLLGSIGFSPNPIYWLQFIRWIKNIDLDTFDVSTPGLITSQWWNSLDKRHMWTQHFILFSLRLNLFTLYANLPEGETLAAHMRAKGEHYAYSFGADFPVAQSVVLNFPDQLRLFGWDGNNMLSSTDHNETIMFNTMKQTAQRIHAENGFVYLMFLNSGFLDMTKSWICNTLAVASDVLKNTLIISSDYVTTRNLFAFHPNINIFTKMLNIEQVVSFGSFAYYTVVLERLRVQDELLQEGISIQVIESDQFWRGNITPNLQAEFELHDIIGGQEGPFPLDNESLGRICGGFHGIASNEKTRTFFSSYVSSYDQKLQERRGEKNSSQLSDLNTYEDDQAALTRLATEEGFQVKYLDRCTYANGLWFKVSSYPAACPKPLVLHNGYIVGNSEKVQRAKKLGRWYLSQDGLHCLKSVEI
jgi:hypothetical protein